MITAKKYLLGKYHTENEVGNTVEETIYQPIEQKFSKTAKNICTDGKVVEEGEGLLKRCYMFIFYDYLEFELTPDGLMVDRVRRVNKKEKIVVSPKFLTATNIKVVSKPVTD
jgi:hypothetical protein